MAGQPKKATKRQTAQQGRQTVHRCMVCKKTMKQVTPAHLRTHGLTVSRYERMYGMRPTPSSAVRVKKDEKLPNAVAERLLDDKLWLATVSDEVGERMLNGPLRQRLSILLTTMLYQRAKIHGESVAILNGALEELGQEWRLTQAADGGPVPTEDLLRIIQTAGKLARDAEEGVARAVKLALEEQKAAAEYADGLGPSLYTGQAEKAGLPLDLPPGDREAMRILTNKIASVLAKRREPIDVEAHPTTPHPQGAGTPPGTRALAQVPGEQRTMATHGNDVVQALRTPGGGAGGGEGSPPILSTASNARQRGERGGPVDGAPGQPLSTSVPQSGDPPEDRNNDASPQAKADASSSAPAAARKRRSPGSASKKVSKRQAKNAASKRKKGNAGRPTKKSTKKTAKKRRKKRGG